MSREAAGRLAPLDGIRAVAVLAVLAFHSELSWASGGFLGVSVFFTLSGFLITSLLLGEHGREGRIDLRRFWGRRVRRLVPAATLGVVLAALLGRYVLEPSASLSGDLLAALALSSNWRWLATGSSYQALFSAPSPLLHYWSLAIEQQFYLVFPLVVVAALRRSRRALLVVVVVGLVGSWALLVGSVATRHLEVAYYATPARLGEILVGAVLALAIRPSGPVQGGWRRLGAMAPVALLALVALVAVIDQRDPQAYLAIPVTALLTGVLIVDAVAGGVTARALAAAPLVALGRVSYGVYVYHWPIFLWLTAARTGLGVVPLLGLRLAVTLGLALLSHRLVEQPALGTRRLPRPAVPALGLGYAVVALVLVSSASGLRPAVDLDAAAARLERAAAPDAPSGGTAEEGTDPTHRLMVFGDSTALMTAVGLLDWAEQTGHVLLPGVTAPGCGLELPGKRRFGGEPQEVPAGCLASARRWPSHLAAGSANVAVIQLGPWEVLDRLLPGDDTWRNIGDPTLAAAYENRARRAERDLFAAGATDVVWLTTAPVHPERNPRLAGKTLPPEADPARMRRFDALLAELASEDPRVHLVDLAGWLDGQGEATEARLRPDGAHFTEATSREVATWLGPAIEAAVTAPTALVHDAAGAQG